jgi:hypothetical protein
MFNTSTRDKTVVLPVKADGHRPGSGKDFERTAFPLSGRWDGARHHCSRHHQPPR